MKVVLVILAAVRLAAAGDSALDWFPANTKVVFGVRVPAVTGSALFRDVGPGAQRLGEEWLKAVAIRGFDPLRDIDEILLASPADNEKADALLVLRGRFDLSGAGAGATHYRGATILFGGASKSVLALLDATTALAGDSPVVRAALERTGKGTAMDAALAARVQSLRERFDVWGTGERTDGFVAPSGKNEQLDSMDRFEFGVRMSKGFEFAAELHGRSPEAARKLAASLESLKTMANGMGPPGPKIDVQLKDGTVKISLAISEDDLKKTIAAQRGVSFGASPPAGGAPVVVSSEPAAAAPQTNIGGTSVFVLPGKK